MISPNSIEPLDTINTDLSWNKVTKGVRSSTRRPRKINQSLNIGLIHNDTGNNEGHLVPESKEFGAAAPGHHFSEKIDHLPIKKRRCMQQSLPSSPRITYEQKPFVNEKPVCSEDSYGIELLATAACSTSIDADFHNAIAVKIKATVETRPENIVCSAEEISILKDVKVEDHADFRGKNTYPVVSESIRDKCDYETGKSSSAGRDARLHWDLNTVMDEWELSPENISTISRSEMDNSAQVIKKLEFPDGGTSLGINPIPSESPFLEKLNTPTTKMMVKVEDHYLSSDLQLGQTLAVENAQLREQNIDMVDPTISENSVCDVAGLKFEENNISDGRSTKNMSEKQGIKAAVGAPADCSLKVEVKKNEQKSYGRFDEDALDDSLDDGDVSDYSPSGYNHLVIIEKMSKNNSGYESPVEDGEFRESWHENEGENDCLDVGIGNLCVPEAGSDSNKNLPERVNFGKSDSEKESSQSVTTGNSAERNQVYKGFAKIVEENNVKLGEVGGFDSTQKFEGKGSLEEKQGSRAIRAKSSTHVQRLSGSRVFGGNDIRDVQRSSTSCYQDGQMYPSNKFVRDRSIHGGDVASNWGSKNHYQNNYRRGGGNPRRRSNNGPDSDDDELAYNQRGSRGGYRSLDRRRSPDDNHNFMNNRNFMTRDERHYNSRGGSRFYRQGYIRDDRNEYHDIVSNDPTAHNHSVYNRDTSVSRQFRKSPSRSRTKSPVPWHLQRERNLGPKRTSRSPSFTSEEVRMGRSRIHYGESKFLENKNEFLSPSRKHFFNDQNGGPGRFRERESPGRFIGQRQRFGSNGNGGRIKADDGGFRPRYSNTNSGRFSDHSGGGWRGKNNNVNDINDDNNYDGSNSERRRYDNKHEMIRRVRHSDVGGADRRFRGNPGNLFEDNNNRNEFNNKNSCIRSSEKGEKCDAGRRFRSNPDDCFKDDNYNRNEYKDKNSFNRSIEKSETCGADRRFRSNPEDCLEDKNNHNEYNNISSCIRSTEKCDALGNGNMWEGEKGRHLMYDGDAINNTSS